MDPASAFALLIAAGAGVVAATVALAEAGVLVRRACRIAGPRLTSSSARWAAAAVLVFLGTRALPTAATMPPPVLRLGSDWEEIAGAIATAPGRLEAAAAVAPAGPEYVVEPGDSLWAIAHRTLRAKASGEVSTADVALYWPVIYELNRSVIGTDPDLIFPGQRLVLPQEP